MLCLDIDTSSTCSLYFFDLDEWLLNEMTYFSIYEHDSCLSLSIPINSTQYEAALKTKMSSKWIHYPGWVVGCYQLFDQTMDQLDYISPVAFMCAHFRYAWTWQHLQKEGRWNVCQLKLYRCFHCCQTNPAFSWLCEYNCAKNDKSSLVIFRTFLLQLLFGAFPYT